ncbi:G patch domain and ankyrin repeat-containing protein 1-like [Brassica rapa]|uniref:G-patch domain-containing protein n=1 Tax=Brassica campestris TaxID=3711 RepID=M4EQM4_BRACM|nr:G patch domain and ankyrin repeat-containing protein 1-like [Brassica rapa]
MMVETSERSSSLDVAIDSSNIGFKLLKKQGWKEGTGLGISQQGILEPLQTLLKNNKRGLGAEITTKRKAAKPHHSIATDSKQVAKKAKKLSKKMRKMIEHEKHLLEKEFERAFFREFWPDNV